MWTWGIPRCKQHPGWLIMQGMSCTVNVYSLPRWQWIHLSSSMTLCVKLPWFLFWVGMPSRWGALNPPKKSVDILTDKTLDWIMLNPMSLMTAQRGYYSAIHIVPEKQQSCHRRNGKSSVIWRHSVDLTWNILIWHVLVTFEPGKSFVGNRIQLRKWIKWISNDWIL